MVIIRAVGNALASIFGPTLSMFQAYSIGEQIGKEFSKQRVASVSAKDIESIARKQGRNMDDYKLYGNVG